jgi:hypothetical protein
MKILCTFSGKFGDILWSLPTVREIHKREYVTGTHEIDTQELHFGIMPQYESLLPLLNAQSYIDKAFVIPNWICAGSPHGDQPWEAPVLEGYDKVYHLTYRYHPGKNEPLIDFIARQQGITLSNPVPFFSTLPGLIGNIEERSDIIKRLKLKQVYPTVTYAFNDSMIEQKIRFLEGVKDRLSTDKLHEMVNWQDVSKLPWQHAAHMINNSICFLGCRSSNYVLACGLGQKVFVYEPNIARSRFGQWGTTFSCPYADETEISYTSIYQMVDYVKSKIVEVVK